MTAVTFSDAWFVERLGTAALASLALACPFLTLMQMMAGGVTMSGLYMIVLGLIARPIFQLLDGEDAALSGAASFARVAFGGVAATWSIWVISAIYRGTGDTATPARAIGAALGWFGLPALGVVGTAAALVICQGLAADYLVVLLVRGEGRIRLRQHAPRWAPVLDIMRVGGPGLINSICMAMTVVIITSLVGRYGTEALAGYGLGTRLELMLAPIAFGVGAALTAAVGANVLPPNTPAPGVLPGRGPVLPSP